MAPLCISNFDMKRCICNTSIDVLRKRLYSSGSSSQFAAIFQPITSERQNELLGPDQRFPLPGDTCHHSQYQTTANRLEEIRRSLFDKAKANTTTSSISTVLAKCDNTYADLDHLKKQISKDVLPDVPVEIIAQKCTRLLRKEFNLLFPSMKNTIKTEINVVNLCQKSGNDQSAWSREMELEREKLTENFISSAKGICRALHKQGYWADFIDPASGRPFLSDYGNMTLFETNEVYTQMGFMIEDLGCCKVLKHAKWGTHAFVGTIFTDAPLESAVMRRILGEAETGSNATFEDTSSSE